jgi:hypothetical protein
VSTTPGDLKNQPFLRRKVRRGSIVVANDRQLAPGAEDAGEAHIANVRQQGEGGFFICLFKP